MLDRASALEILRDGEIEIVGRPKPAVRLSGRLRQIADAHGVTSIDLSMTHSRELAQAVAVVDA